MTPLPKIGAAVFLHAARYKNNVVGRIDWCACAILVMCLLFYASTPVASADTRNQISALKASPASFVPDWDGHTDSSVVGFRLRSRSFVVAQVIDGNDRTVMELARGSYPSGHQSLTWDGRLANGSVAVPGKYYVRITTHSVARKSNKSSSNAASAQVLITLRRPAVTLTSIKVMRTSLGRARGKDQTSALYRLSRPASVSAAIINHEGRVVRTLSTGRSRAGMNVVAWDGKDSAKRVVVDGSYSLAISATAGQRPTNTIRLPITVDRTVPTLNVARTGVATLVGESSLKVRLSVRSSEAGQLVVANGMVRHQQDIRAGQSTITIDGDDLSLRALGAARRVTLILQVRDSAGNTRVARVTVQIPKRRVTAPPAHESDESEQGSPAPLWSWPWPIDGIVTSEFGQRNGRPHEGLDIAGPSGTPIHPSKSGRVSFVGTYGGYGNLVIVDHGLGLTTRYAHMSRYGGYQVGESVDHTSIIGFVGCTGSCTGPHVHFEVRTNEQARNPRAYLK